MLSEQLYQKIRREQRVKILSRSREIAQYAKANVAWGRSRDRELKKKHLLSID